MREQRPRTGAAAFLFIAALSATLMMVATSAAASDRFDVRAVGSVSSHLLVAISETLEENHDRIITALGNPTVGRTPVRVWADRMAFQESWGGGAGGVGDGYVNTQTMEIRLLASERAPEVAVHEFAHIVTLALNRSIPYSAFWLWETAALHVDGSAPMDLAQLTCLGGDGPPSLAELSAYPANRKVFRVGHHLGAFIDQAWGSRAIGELIRAAGDTEIALGVSVAALERRWAGWIHERRSAEPRKPLSAEQVRKALSGQQLRTVDGSRVRARYGADGAFEYRIGEGQPIDGSWRVAANGDVCLDFGGPQARCAPVYAGGPERFDFAPNSDCAVQTWLREP